MFNHQSFGIELDTENSTRWLTRNYAWQKDRSIQNSYKRKDCLCLIIKVLEFSLTQKILHVDWRETILDKRTDRSKTVTNCLCLIIKVLELSLTQKILHVDWRETILDKRTDRSKTVTNCLCLIIKVLELSLWHRKFYTLTDEKLFLTKGQIDPKQLQIVVFNHQSFGI